MKHLVVDGYLHGTGIRDKITGEVLEPKRLGLSSVLSRKIALWLQRYWEAFYSDYKDKILTTKLDQEGVMIANELSTEVPDDYEITYYSDALMQYLPRGLQWSNTKLHELEVKIKELDQGQNYYILNADSRTSTFMLRENKAKRLWEYFYLDKQGNMRDYRVFNLEEEACDYVYKEAFWYVNVAKISYASSLEEKIN